MIKLSLRITRLICASAVAATLWFGGPAEAASVPESDDPIVLALNEWSGQQIDTHVAATILKRIGYNVKLVAAGYFPQMAALTDGSITATLEIWQSNIGEHFDKAVNSGKAVDLGPLGLDARDAWFYPDYVAEVCPGLPDWQALRDCVEVFATPETLPKGRFVDYPADWGGNNDKRLDALGLDFVAVPAGSEGSIIAELKAAVLRKQPILLQFWQPHWIHAEISGNWIDLPAYEDPCETDASWGVNPEKAFDCAWNNGWVKKVAWAGMENKWPVAFGFLKNFQMSNEHQTPMLKAVDVDGEDIVTVAQRWVDEHEAVWRPWVDAAMKE